MKVHQLLEGEVKALPKKTIKFGLKRITDGAIKKAMDAVTRESGLKFKETKFKKNSEPSKYGEHLLNGYEVDFDSLATTHLPKDILTLRDWLISRGVPARPYRVKRAPSGLPKSEDFKGGGIFIFNAAGARSYVKDQKPDALTRAIVDSVLKDDE